MVNKQIEPSQSVGFSRIQDGESLRSSCVSNLKSQNVPYLGFFSVFSYVLEQVSDGTLNEKKNGSSL